MVREYHMLSIFHAIKQGVIHDVHDHDHRDHDHDRDYHDFYVHHVSCDQLKDC